MPANGGIIAATLALFIIGTPAHLGKINKYVRVIAAISLLAILIFTALHI